MRRGIDSAPLPDLRKRTTERMQDQEEITIPNAYPLAGDLDAAKQAAEALVLRWRTCPKRVVHGSRLSCTAEMKELIWPRRFPHRNELADGRNGQMGESPMARQSADSPPGGNQSSMTCFELAVRFNPGIPAVLVKSMMDLQSSPRRSSFSFSFAAQESFAKITSEDSPSVRCLDKTFSIQRNRGSGRVRQRDWGWQTVGRWSNWLPISII